MTAKYAATQARWRAANKERISESNKQYRRANRDRLDAYQRNYREKHAERLYFAALKRRFGIGREDYERLLGEQGGVCALCQKGQSSSNKKWLCVDHDHSTGRVRGLLCSRCNQALGLLGDSEAIYLAVIAYLGTSCYRPLPYVTLPEHAISLATVAGPESGTFSGEKHESNPDPVFNAVGISPL